MSNWRAGWCVGPRYIATVAPFLMLPMLRLWPRVERRWWLTAIAVGLLIPSVVLNVVSGALYPHYPESFDNPVFDLAFPLIGEGYAPYGLGWLLHLPGRWALAPLGAAWCWRRWRWSPAGDDPRPRRMAAHLALAIAIGGAVPARARRVRTQAAAGRGARGAVVRRPGNRPAIAPSQKARKEADEDDERRTVVGARGTPRHSRTGRGG